MARAYLYLLLCPIWMFTSLYLLSLQIRWVSILTVGGTLLAILFIAVVSVVYGRGGPSNTPDPRD